jgi:hypothetical protein
LHLINLTHAPTLDTVAQVFYATLLGIGFAGPSLDQAGVTPGHRLIRETRPF